MHANICLKRLHIHLLRSPPPAGEWGRKEANRPFYWKGLWPTRVLHAGLLSLAFFCVTFLRFHIQMFERRGPSNVPDRRGTTHLQAAEDWRKQGEKWRTNQMALHQLLYRGSTCSSRNGLRCERPLFQRRCGPPGSAPSSITAFSGHRGGGGGGWCWWQSARWTPAETRWLAKKTKTLIPHPPRNKREDKWGGGGLKNVKRRGWGGGVTGGGQTVEGWRHEALKG